MNKRLLLCCITAFLLICSLEAEPLYSPTWGFRLDLPEEYEFTGGDGKNQFTFQSSFGAFLDIVVYPNKESAALLAEELEKKLSNRGAKNKITYNGAEAVIMELNFPSPQNRNARFTGWALFLELETPSGGTAPSNRTGTPAKGKNFLTALAYGPDKAELRGLHLSVLDSIEGGERDRRLPGIMTEYFHPRGNWVEQNLAAAGKARFRENDAAAAQSVVDREFQVLSLYLSSGKWQEAWKRFYRAIFKDSFDRLGNAAFILERSWNNSVLGPSGKGIKSEEAERLGTRAAEDAFIAAKALEWVQGFKYERDLEGSDFVNLVSAAQESRGDCDSRALLWAIILLQADIPAGIMVSREFSHSMGIANLEGAGARFPMKDSDGKDIRWLVAETTAPVALGRIGETVSEITKWLGILFE
ncbi:MAG: hypothetical protein LBB72_01915 [Spirochaetaceae bacterium]|jgi:hypothetical protein|nr:hypothetical protein [Spirochaetaceae bacterium]